MSTDRFTKDDLQQFTGSEQWCPHGLARSILFTDGAKYVADKGGAYWLLDEIAFAQKGEPQVAAETQRARGRGAGSVVGADFAPSAGLGRCGLVHGADHGSIRMRPQPSNPLTSRVTTLAPRDRATEAIMRSTVAVGRPACLRAAKMSA